LIFATAGTLFLGLTVSSCKKKKDDTPTSANFDRGAMLSNIGNNIIIPSYQKHATALNSLDSAITAFNLSPTSVGLTATQNIFKNAYRSWQYCSAFELGYAADQYTRISTNTFPIDSNKINSNIAAGTYDLSAPGNAAAKGLPGIDFLLFGSGATNTIILNRFASGSDATNRKKYLADLSSELKTRANNILNSWLPSGGNYISTFISSNGTDVGSATGQLINQYVFDFDILKNDKLGIPLGKQSNGVIYPTKTEGYYSGMSVELASLQVQAAQNIYLGRDLNGNDGLGFDDYLVTLNAKAGDGSSLNDVIKNQFTTTYTNLQAVASPLSQTINNNPSQVDAAYTQCQKLLVLLKTDMTSAMGILITFEDNDGD